MVSEFDIGLQFWLMTEANLEFNLKIKTTDWNGLERFEPRLKTRADAILTEEVVIGLKLLKVF